MAKHRGSQNSGFDLNFGGLFKGLGDFVDKLSEIADKGVELRREGEFEGLGDLKKGLEDLKGIYGFSIKVGGLGGEKQVSVEPFGNIKKNDRGEPTVVDEREPLVDVFEEDDHVLVIAELPGVEESQIKTTLDEDVLTITAESPNRKYRKEILLPEAFAEEALNISFRNGVLEVRFTRQNG
jgi:HSP20 family protein